MTDKKVAPDESIAPIAYSPRQFCRAAGISISLLYTLWREGRGPKFLRPGTANDHHQGRDSVVGETADHGTGQYSGAHGEA
jgi:hypothetical protein